MIRTNGNVLINGGGCMKEIDSMIEHWLAIAPLTQMPKNEIELEKQIRSVDELLDIVGSNEEHPLMGLLDLMSDQIEKYEQKKYHTSIGTGLDALKYLIKEQDIKQSELPEIGSQGVVSEVLNGKRQLNRRQIEDLASRFNVSPSTFFDKLEAKPSRSAR